MRVRRVVVATLLIALALVLTSVVVAGAARLLDPLTAAESVDIPSVPPSPPPQETSVAPTPSPEPSCGSRLQARIDMALPGAVLDISGCIYAESVTISRPLTLRGGTIEPPAGAAGIRVEADSVTIEDVRVVGHGDAQFDGADNGIVVRASAANPVRGLTVRNCEVASLGGHGMLLTHVAGLTVEGNDVHDIVYAGIKVNSGIGGRITDNTVARIGLHDAAANSNNAYGIDLERIVAGDLATNPRTRDFVIANNVVTDVPTWHAIDTHAGDSITITGNTVERSLRPLFITTDSVGTRPSDIIVSDNRLIYPGDPSAIAISVYAADRVTITGNQLVGWPAHTRYWIDPSSTDVAMSTNVSTL